MASSVTVTGTAGPGVTATAVVINDVLSFSFETSNNILSISDTSGAVKQFNVTDATTVTVTKSGSTYTVVVA